MRLAVYLPFVISAAFNLVARRIATRLSPRTATWLLTVGGLLAAVVPVVSLLLLSSTLIGLIPFVAGIGHWSPAAFERANPVWAPVAAVALCWLAVVGVRLTIDVVRQLQAFGEVRRFARALPMTVGGLAVVVDDVKQAFAIPGRGGTIVMSTGMLRGLDARQRRAVIAHERSHCEHRHFLHVGVARLARSANPLLSRLPAAMTFVTERWADEDAAVVCSGRGSVAGALVSAAERGPMSRPSVRSVPQAALMAATIGVDARVRALQRPAPTASPWRVALLVALMGLLVAAGLEATHDLHQLFELASEAHGAR